MFGDPQNPKMKISLFYKTSTAKAFSLLLIMSFISPGVAQASFLSDLVTKVIGTDDTSAEVLPSPDSVVHNSQTVPLLESSINPDLKSIKDAPVADIIQDQALVYSNGSLSPSDDLEKYASSAKINTYIVKKGDTVESIAKKFKVTKDVIIYSNADLKKSDLLKIGQNIVILPVKDLNSINSTQSVPEKTPTNKDIKKTVAVESAPVVTKTDESKNKESVQPVVANNLTDKTVVSVAAPVSMPQSDISAPLAASISVQTPVVDSTTSITPVVQAPQGQPSGSITGGYIWPFPEGVGRVSQGLHADQAYDFAAPKGTPIYAVHDGTVLIAHPTGYNGGFGLYVVIDFTDGRQAIFGHMSKVVAKAGDVVKQGDIIGYVGSTGQSTGPHTHIGFHGTLSNPYIGLKVNSTDVENND